MTVEISYAPILVGCNEVCTQGVYGSSESQCSSLSFAKMFTIVIRFYHYPIFSVGLFCVWVALFSTISINLFRRTIISSTYPPSFFVGTCSKLDARPCIWMFAYVRLLAVLPSVYFSVLDSFSVVFCLRATSCLCLDQYRKIKCSGM